MNIKNILKSLLQKGFRIGFSTGKMFDPTDQERTDPIKDIIEAEEKRKKKKEWYRINLKKGEKR